jgi:FkbM family methyltransferase
MTSTFTQEELHSVTGRICGIPESLRRPKDLEGAWVFGAGSLGQLIAGWLRDNGVAVAGFIDNRPVCEPEDCVLGLPVRRPGSAGVSRCGWIIIAAKDQAASIEEQCRQLGYTKLVRGWHALHLWADSTLVAGYVSPLDEFIRRWESYSEILPLLADQESRNILGQAITYQITFADVDLPPRDPHEYFRPGFPPDIVFREAIDGGAYTGDTLAHFLRVTGGRFHKYDAFEPDEVSFHQLSQYVAALPAAVRTLIATHHAALGSSAGQHAFSTGKGMTSAMHADGNAVVPVLPLDQVCVDRRPSFLKLDIEGGEMSALVGAETLIRRSQPVLAICIYHRPSHYYDIVRWISDLSLGYRLYLRHHSNWFTGTVCYAIPDRLHGIASI